MIQSVQASTCLVEEAKELWVQKLLWLLWQLLLQRLQHFEKGLCQPS